MRAKASDGQYTDECKLKRVTYLLTYYLAFTAVTFSDSLHISSTDFTKENTHKCIYANEQKLCVDDNVTRPTRFL